MNPCENCALCCMKTEMLLSRQDIELIKKKIKSDQKREDFIEVNMNGLSQLKNINGNCVFLDPEKKVCRIYDFRPFGCRFYPIVYNLEKGECDYDKDCPRTNLFHLPSNEFKAQCNKVKIFLKKGLGLAI